VGLPLKLLGFSGYVPGLLDGLLGRGGATLGRPVMDY